MTEKEILQCFRREPSGMWRCVRGVTLSGPNGSIGMGPGMSFGRGVAFMGIDLASYLDGLVARYGAPQD